VIPTANPNSRGLKATVLAVTVTAVKVVEAAAVVAVALATAKAVDSASA
jgi:hypothetical protein|tara:strand:+ start:1093 stop:1239 length:147 start_codon:yes stop_codon:yes gene_type:complete